MLSADIADPLLLSNAPHKSGKEVSLQHSNSQFRRIWIRQLRGVIQVMKWKRYLLAPSSWIWSIVLQSNVFNGSCKDYFQRLEITHNLKSGKAMCRRSLRTLAYTWRLDRTQIFSYPPVIRYEIAEIKDWHLEIVLYSQYPKRKRDTGDNPLPWNWSRGEVLSSKFSPLSLPGNTKNVSSCRQNSRYKLQLQLRARKSFVLHL